MTTSCFRRAALGDRLRAEQYEHFAGDSWLVEHLAAAAEPVA